MGGRPASQHHNVEQFCLIEGPKDTLDVSGCGLRVAIARNDGSFGHHRSHSLIIVENLHTARTLSSLIQIKRSGR